MELLKKRSIAILITVVVAIAATLFGVHKTADQHASKVEAMFYEGIYLKDEGYTQPGLATHLDSCANAALGLATTLEKYPELAGRAEELLSVRRELIAAESISDKSSANQQMRRCFIDLLDAAQFVDLSEQDIESVKQYYAQLFGATSAIFNSRYNDKAYEHFVKFGQSRIVFEIDKLFPLKHPDYFNLITNDGKDSWPWDDSHTLSIP